MVVATAGNARGDRRPHPKVEAGSLGSVGTRRLHPGSGADLSIRSLTPQLYELDGDPKRKEFLDDLFSFMQKRGEAAHRASGEAGEGRAGGWGLLGR